MLDVKNILTEELERSKTAIIDNMKANDQYVSGKTANSLRVDVAEDSGILWGAPHFLTLETGISPFESQQTPFKKTFYDLRQWFIDKGISDNPSEDRRIFKATTNQREIGSVLFRRTGGTPTGLVYGKEVNPLLQRIGSRIVDKIINIKVIT